MTPSIYDFLDYRQFLRAWYESEKNRLPAFSYRYFARKAGFSSPNFLKLVIDGDRNLSPDSMERFVEALKFTQDEGGFFRDLVAYNQARNLAEKNLLFDRVIASKRFQQWRKLDVSLLDYMRHWYYPAIRELAALPDFRAEAAWIAPRLVSNLDPEEIEKALAILEELGLLIRNADGDLVRSDQTVSTGPRVLGEGRIAARSFLREMLERASESMDVVPAELRELGSITVAIRASTIPELKERILRFRRELLERCDQDVEPDEVYQFNVQLFPLTRRPREDSQDE